MPRYQYRCELCESEFTVVHGINERLEKCQSCKKVGNLKKVYMGNLLKGRKEGIKDSEMISTFNCGVGFCLIADKKNLNKIKKIFPKQYKPYEIGFLSKNKDKFKISGKLQWKVK